MRKSRHHFCDISIETAWNEVQVAQSCLTLCDPTDCTVHGILQARILEWVAFPFSRGSSQPGEHCRRSLYQLSHKGSPRILEWAAIPSPEDLSDPGIKLGSPTLQADSLSSYQGSPESESCSVVSDSLLPHGLSSPWSSPGQNNGVGSLSLLQGIFPPRD